MVDFVHHINIRIKAASVLSQSSTYLMITSGTTWHVRSATKKQPISQANTIVLSANTMEQHLGTAAY